MLATEMLPAFEKEAKERKKTNIGNKNRKKDSCTLATDKEHKPKKDILAVDEVGKLFKVGHST